MCSLPTVPALVLMESDPRSGLRKIYRTVNMFLRPPDYHRVHQTIVTKLNSMKGLFYPDIGGVMVGFTKVKVDKSTRDPVQGAKVHMVKLGAEFFIFKPVAGCELQCEVIGREEGEMKYRALGYYEVKVIDKTDDDVWPGQQVVVKVEGVEHSTPDQPPIIMGKFVDEAAEVGGPLIEDVEDLEVSEVEDGMFVQESLDRSKGDVSNSRNNREESKKRKLSVNESNKETIEPNKKMKSSKNHSLVTSTGSPDISAVVDEGPAVSTQMSPKKKPSSVPCSPIKKPLSVPCSPIKKPSSIPHSPINKLPKSFPSCPSPASSTSLNLCTFQPLVTEEPTESGSVVAEADPVVTTDKKVVEKKKSPAGKKSKTFELPPLFSKKMRGGSSSNKVDHYLAPNGEKLMNQKKVMEWVEEHPNYMIKSEPDATEVVDTSTNRDMSGLTQHDPAGTDHEKQSEEEGTEYQSQSILKVKINKNKTNKTANKNKNLPKKPKKSLGESVKDKLTEEESAVKIDGNDKGKTPAKSQFKPPDIPTARESDADSGCQVDRKTSKESDSDSSAEEESHLSPVQPGQLPKGSVESDSDSSDDDEPAANTAGNAKNLNKSNLQVAGKYSSSESDSGSGSDSDSEPNSKKDKDASKPAQEPTKQLKESSSESESDSSADEAQSQSLLKDEIIKPKLVAPNLDGDNKSTDKQSKLLASKPRSDSSDDSDESSDDESSKSKLPKTPTSLKSRNVDSLAKSPIYSMLKNSVKGAATSYATALARNQEHQNEKKDSLETQGDCTIRNSPPNLSSTMMPSERKSKLEKIKAPDGISPIPKSRHENKSGTSQENATHLFDTVMRYDNNEGVKKKKKSNKKHVAGF